MFHTASDLARATGDTSVTREIAARFCIPAEDVTLHVHRTTNSAKWTFLRPIRAGDLEDADLYGAQQFAAILSVELPES
jgi:hypothetical protein